MGRYTRRLKLKVEPGVLMNFLNSYLPGQGYKPAVVEGEQVFKKGDGWLTGPCIIKPEFAGEYVLLQAWIKYAILPHVYTGEMDISEGFVGAIPKSQLRSFVAMVENMMVSNGLVESAVSGAPTDGSVVCMKCGCRSKGGNFCEHCGGALN